MITINCFCFFSVQFQFLSFEKYLVDELDIVYEHIICEDKNIASFNNYLFSADKSFSSIEVRHVATRPMHGVVCLVTGSFFFGLVCELFCDMRPWAAIRVEQCHWWAVVALQMHRASFRSASFFFCDVVSWYTLIYLRIFHFILVHPSHYTDSDGVSRLEQRCCRTGYLCIGCVRHTFYNVRGASWDQ